jgi:hypothetical protein
VARFDFKETADDAVAALHARVAELAQSANAQQDRDELDVVLRLANPRFFVVGESELSRAELATTREKIQRLRGPNAGTASVEERFLRVYWPRINPTLVVIDTSPTSMHVPAAGSPQATESGNQPATKPKRSTKKGDARLKIIAALTKHHQYADGSCLNTEPVRVNQLARQAGVGSSSTVTEFFKKQFNGHGQYEALCRRSPADLVTALKLLNGVYSPHLLYGNTPPGEGIDDE